jgi:hypothetical protein
VSPSPIHPISLPLEQYLDAIVAGTMTVHDVLVQAMALDAAALR